MMTGKQMRVEMRACVLSLLFAGALGWVPALGAEPMEELTAGEVRPEGWLRDWCETVRDGYMTTLDDVDEHFRIAWTTNAIRRGKQLHWPDGIKGSWSAEGGSYWFDGLVRLAWELDDPKLKRMAKRRLDTLLDNMNPNAIVFLWWLDRRNPAHIDELRVAGDGWICWAMANLSRAIIAYYKASGDERALRALNWAFNDERFYNWSDGRNMTSAAWEVYQTGHDPAVKQALDHWWAAGGPDWKHPAWRYAKHPDEADKVLTPYTQAQRNWILQHGVMACETLIAVLRDSYWPTGDRSWRANAIAWADYLAKDCMQPYGVPVADESYGWAGPDRATETCTVAAYIRLSIEMARLLGEGRYGDRVERAFFNAAAACTNPDFDKHVYVQTPNRTVVESRADFTCPTTARYFLHKQWPLCCTAALTRYVPDYVQHLWMKTADGGLAAALYAPSTVETTLGGTKVKVRTVTDYPFGETLRFEVAPERPLAFPLRLRLPGWCASSAAKVNGADAKGTTVDGYLTLVREWKAGDVVELSLPMKPRAETILDRNKPGEPTAWTSFSAGPLLFARAIRGKDENTVAEGERTEWKVDPAKSNAVLRRGTMPAKWRWEPSASPVRLDVDTDAGRLELVPYGSAMLRVSMFRLID